MRPLPAPAKRARSGYKRLLEAYGVYVGNLDDAPHRSAAWVNEPAGP